MDLIKLEIPFAFIRERADLTWQETLYGLEQELLDTQAPADLACDKFVREASPDKSLLELSSLRRVDDPIEYVKRLAAREPAPSSETLRDRWLYLVLCTPIPSSSCGCSAPACYPCA